MSKVIIRIVDSSAEFERLAEAWEALQARIQNASIFESFDWQYLWWKTYGHAGKLRLLLAFDEGSLIGILPLHIQTERVASFPVRLLRFVGYGSDTAPDDLGPILLPGREQEVATAFARAATRLRGWDVLQLTDMDPTCSFPAALKAALRGQLLPWRTGRSERIVLASLRPSWDEWLGTLHRDRRYALRRARKKLHAAYPARFFVWNDGEKLDHAIDRLIHLHRKRWNTSAETSHSFATPQYIEFHRAVMTACFRRDRLRLYCLELSGQIAAMYYFYKFRDKIYLMQSGFDPDLSHVRPGHVLLGYVFEHAISERSKVLDFLKGDHRYKDELANGERHTLFVEAFARRPGALVYVTRRIILPAIKRPWRRTH